MRKFLEVLLERHPDLKGGKVVALDGPNGRFISATTQDGSKSYTFPVGNKSYTEGVPSDLTAFNAMISADGTLIATMNTYEEVSDVITL